jgi:sugar lactone lactonase YvrE
MAPYPPYAFGRPTDIAFDAQGNFFVSDGYEFSRVVKYDKNGTFIKSVGTRGSGPSQFSTPHGIAADANGNVYVADRGNRRIQVLSNDLVLRDIYEHVGSPWAVCITPGPHQYLYSSNSNSQDNDSRTLPYSGEVYKMELDGTVVGRFGQGGKLLKEFTTIHAMDCKADNDLLVGEIDGWRVQHLILHPQGQSPSSR